MATQSSGVGSRIEEPGGRNGSRSLAVASTGPYQGNADEMTAFNVGAVRYIKLGEGGKWAGEAIRAGILPFGYRAVAHTACAQGDWDRVREQLITMGRTKTGVGQGLRELQAFYSMGEDTLWVTIADGHLWWTFADAKVIAGDQDYDAPARFRRTRGGWRCTSLGGVPLTSRSLSSALTSTANYQMTICAVRQADYLLRRIRGEDEPLRAESDQLLSDMTTTVAAMVRRLDWRDFETLIDLIFSRGGWQRISLLGGNQADVDLILRQPIIGETAWVQIKSQTSQAEFDDYLGRFEREASCDFFFFIYHSAARPIRGPAATKVRVWSADQIASAAIDAGLLRWLSDRLI
ncbi:restriction endonuclease [Bradyrhizobium tropiciagri]|uniref:restriction endonuclease n=1 Tax=Bradyrhizobium tropiciagri TaxID=312253 RepID=UPI001FCDD079|nr:restriction endonuclease [Bradyrhizobium tropiciagri]